LKPGTRSLPGFFAVDGALRARHPGGSLPVTCEQWSIAEGAGQGRNGEQRWLVGGEQGTAWWP
jgi:hypothetical protein